jgi:hypothetical protein
MAVKQVFIVEKIWLCQGYKELVFRQEITETFRNSCKNQAMQMKKTFETLTDNDRQTLWMLKNYKCYQGIEA